MQTAPLLPTQRVLLDAVVKNAGSVGTLAAPNHAASNSAATTEATTTASSTAIEATTTGATAAAVKATVAPIAASGRDMAAKLPFQIRSWSRLVNLSGDAE
jgi:hypothetical protein